MGRRMGGEGEWERKGEGKGRVLDGQRFVTFFEIKEWEGTKRGRGGAGGRRGETGAEGRGRGGQNCQNHHS